MKNVFFPLVVFFLTSCGSESDSTGGDQQKSPTPESDGLIAYFPFDGDATDQSTNGIDGVLNGATLTTDRHGVENGAYEFNGTSDFISVPLNINPSEIPELTLTAWVKPNIATPIRQVISNDGGGFDRSLGIDSRSGELGWSLFAGSSLVLGHFPINLNKWVFIAAVYDQEDETVKLYLNDQHIEGSGTLGEGLDELRIGSNPTFGEFFSGAIDEVKIYNKALSDTEIAELYNASKPEEGVNLPNLSGTWEESLFGSYFGDATIIQDKEKLEITNFENNFTNGTVTENNLITTVEWGLTATVSQDNKN